MTGPREASNALRRLGVALPLAALASSLGFPGIVLADTLPGGGPGQTPPVDPLGSVIAMVQSLVFPAIAVAIIVGGAALVARLGTRPTSGPTRSDAAREQGSPSFSSRRSPLVALGVLVAAGAIGVGVGREIAYERSAGGFLGGVFLTAVAVLIEGGIVSVGVLALLIRRGRLSPAVATTLATAVMVAIGAFTGLRTASATGGLYRPPVVLEATGHLNLVLRDGGGTFVSRADGMARCSSVPDHQAVEGISALDLGELGAGTLRGSVYLPEANADQPSVSFFIDGGDLPEGSGQPTWSGPLELDHLGPGRASGTAAFESLSWTDGAVKPGSGESPSLPAGEWPARISGTLTWTCGPWN